MWRLENFVKVEATLCHGNAKLGRQSGLEKSTLTPTPTPTPDSNSDPHQSLFPHVEGKTMFNSDISFAMSLMQTIVGKLDNKRK